MNKDLEAAKERWSEARDASREQHARMREDLEFSNPADPKQWDDNALTTRKGRPCLTFDRTNQFISQVVNDARRNKPAIHVLPADSMGDVAVAEKLNGIIRHIEYTSRAGIAYDTAIENAARCGMGWLRVVPEVMRPDTNEQEIRIQRIHDVFSVSLDPNSTEPDGMDAMWGQVETVLTNRAFERLYPKAKKDSWDGDGWFTSDSVRICEEFHITEKKQNRIVIGDDSQRMTLTEDEYWELNQRTGMTIPIVERFEATVRKQTWRKFSGCEVLEETEFPSRYVPLVPVYGYEVWIDDKRFICGMTRRMMDSQRAYNYERSAFIEAVALQPKAPFMASSEAIEGHEDDWQRANRGNPAYLPFNAYDEQGRQLPMPQRQSPPTFPVAFAQGGQIATSDMEAAIGMFKANLGQTTNETSGRAIMARQREGDTANFHYIDNLSRSIEQLGRIVVDMIPRIYDTARQARIVGEDGKHDFVRVDPSMGQAVKKEGKKVVAINPGIGAYDVRVKAGPSFTSQRQESAEQLSQILQRAPALLPILGDVWVRMQDWPESEKVSQRLKAMLPPELKALEEPGEDDPDPQAQAAMQAQQMGQQIQAMEQAGMKLQQDLQAAQQELEKMQAQLMHEQAKRLKAEIDAQRADAMLDVSQAEQQAMANVTQARGEEQAPAPAQPQSSVVVLDGQGNLMGALTPAMEGIAQASMNTERVLTSMAQDQQALAALIAQGQEQMALLMQQMAQPKQAQIRISKQPDGSFVGEKVEV